MIAFWQQAIELAEAEEQLCIGIIVGKSGSAPQVPGAKSIFLRDGRIIGTIGGGCLEVECRRLALQVMQSGKAVVRQFQLDDDFGWDDGLICGGRVDVMLTPLTDELIEAARKLIQARNGELIYFLDSGKVAYEKEWTQLRPIRKDDQFIEPYPVPFRAIFFGGGHVGHQTSKLAAELGFDVTLVDDREAFVDPGRAPWANAVCDSLEEYAQRLQTSELDFVCIVTRGHRNDSRVLRHLIKKRHAYLGMIGSRRKRVVIQKQMVDEGWCTEEQFAQVRSPMGIDIGSETVEEIALSIVAEMVQMRSEIRGRVMARASNAL